MIGLIIPLVAKLGVPKRFQRIAAWIGVVATAIALLWAGWAILKASIIDDHEKNRAVRSIDARDKSAEERADDAVRNLLAEKDREGAIKAAPNAGATLAPSTVAANCARLRAAYSAEDLAKSDAYRELCK